MVRRLNRREYQHSVQDLFQLSELPDLSLPADGTSGRNFDTDGESLTLGPGDYELYYVTAEAIAEAVIAKGETPFDACAAMTAPDLGACMEAELPSFLSNVFRQPASPEAIAQSGMLLLVDGTFEDALRSAIVPALVSPHFVFHYKTPADARTTDGVDALEVADRLSYFLWSSTPDAELRAAAADGSLLDHTVLIAQTRRLLADEKAERFLEDFVLQWLSIDDFVADAAGSERESLFRSMREETLRFALHVLKNDAPLARLLDETHSVINQELATHYGVDFPEGDEEWALVEMPAERRGLLSQGSLLTARAVTTESNPITRGVWVAEFFACVKPPPPPEEAGVLQALEEGQTIREALEQHRSDAACAGCHQVFDFYGLALEEFDTLGRFRETYENDREVDGSGELPSGETFQTTAELAQVMAERHEFSDCVSELVASYGLGRDIRGARAEFLAQSIGELADDEGIRMSDVVMGIVTSNEFATAGGDR